MSGIARVRWVSYARGIYIMCGNSALYITLCSLYTKGLFNSLAHIMGLEPGMNEALTMAAFLLSFV